MESILNSLGINSSLYDHFALFFFTYLVVSFLVFRPYAKAHKAREERTVGSQDHAVKLWAESEKLREQFQTKAKELNLEIKGVVDGAKKKAMSEYQEQIQAAQEDYGQRLDQLKARVDTARAQALASVDREVTPLSQSISDKLLGRNVNA